MNVEFTPAFIEHAKKIANKVEYNAMYIHVKTVGCNGLAYQFDPTLNGLPDDGTELTFKVDDFEIIFPKDQVKIFEGAKFDYVRQGLNTRVVVTNPNATSQCGCGESFNVA
jgi:iron-sulfur cluster assembly accessory protein